MEEHLPRKYGKYTLLRRLAVGGMAEIFLALHRSISGFEKLLVIKRILPNLTQDPDFLRMFLDEARIAATLNHPNIAQIYDVGSCEGSYFIAMEYVHGEDLRSIVRSMKKAGAQSFPLEHALQIIVGICAGLDYAHTRTDLQGEPLEIVHRDVSPQNVLVTFAGDVKVVDFGIARARLAGSEQNTERGQLKGKVPYMSPEQCRGEPLDRRSDIFSTGIILFEMTTGRRLFRGATEFNTLRMIVEEDYPRPSHFREDFSPDLEAIVMRALEKDRERRYQSALELRADLEAYIREHRVVASSLALAKFLEELFADRIAMQREALAQGKRLADVLSAEEDAAPELPSGELVELDPEGRPASGSLSGPRPAGPSTAAWVEQKRSGLAARLAVALVALVVVLGTGGAIFFFTRSGETTTTVGPEPTGALEVRSSPEGATISLDGTETERRTPHTFEDLRLDRTYQVKLTLEGYRHEMREVKLSAARPRDVVSAELSPSGAVILTVKSVPAGATVFLDGREVPDRTPATISGVSPLEKHAVLVKLAGHAEVAEEVSARPGQVVELSFQLEEAPLGADEALLVVTSEPRGAAVSIDGGRADRQTPLEMRVKAGQRVTVAVSKAGFRNFSREVRLRGGERLEVAAVLQREAGGGRPPPPSGDPPPPPPSGTGNVYFDAVPFCNVSIDGRHYGPTPLVNVQVPAGRRTIRCASPPIGVTKTFVVDVPAGGTLRRRVELQ